MAVLEVRLTPEEIDYFRNSVSKFDSAAKTFVFGSRANPDVRGGDIDILILSDKISRHELRHIRTGFQERFGDQKVDLVLDSPEPVKIFTAKILKDAVPL